MNMIRFNDFILCRTFIRLYDQAAKTEDSFFRENAAENGGRQPKSDCGVLQAPGMTIN
jgi:hypothetical protein